MYEVKEKGRVLWQNVAAIIFLRGIQAEYNTVIYPHFIYLLSISLDF